MKSCMPLFLFFVLILFSGCKINKDAYNYTQSQIQKKEMELAASGRTNEISQHDINLISGRRGYSGGGSYKRVGLTSVSGMPGEYNVVIKRMINKTNANAYYKRIAESGSYKNACFAKGNDMMYYIIIDSASNRDAGNKILEKYLLKYPKAFIIRK